MCTGHSKEGKHESQENRVPIFGLKSRYYLSESQGNNGGINEYWTCDERQEDVGGKDPAPSPSPHPPFITATIQMPLTLNHS